MRILVTGASGVLGKRVVEEAAKHTVVVLDHNHPTGSQTSSVHGDLATGEGLDEALSGIDAVIHCASDFRAHRQVDVAGAARLVDACAPATHIVYPGIVGSDVIPYDYYRSKIAAEQAITSRPWTVLRTTQFHQMVWRRLEQMSRRPVMLIPGDTRVQPIDPGSVARRLVEAAEAGPTGRLPDLGGRYAYEVKELAASYLAATGRNRLRIVVNYPGLAWAALRAGGNLTPNRDEEGESWNDFVSGKP